MNTFQTYYLDIIKEKYTQFEGRARRTEYWYFTLFNALISFVVGFVDGLLGANSILILIYSLAILLPSLAICVRRLHDVGKSGWFYFIGLIPLVGVIWLFVLFCTPGTIGSNEYGPDPKLQ